MAGIGFGATPIDVFKQRSQEFMEADLARSDLDEHTLYSTALERPPAGHIALSGWCTAAYHIQYWTPNGEPLDGMYRVRVQYKEGITKAQLQAVNTGRGIGKYTGPNSEILRAHSLTTTTPYLYPYSKDSSDIVFICEGEKKAALIAERWGYCTIGIGGCTMWSQWEVDEVNQRPSRVVHEWTRNQIEEVDCSRIVIIPDGDILTNRNVMTQYGNFYAALRIAFPDKRVDVMLPPAPYKGVDDWLAAFKLGSIDQLVDIPEVENALGPAQLIETYHLLPTANNLIQPILDNVGVLLERHPMFKGRLKYNLDTAREEMDGKSVEDHYTTTMQRVMQRVFHMPRVSFGTCSHAIMDVSHKDEYSVAMEDLKSWGEWDGQDWLARIFPWAKGDNRQVLEYLCMGYIKRTLWPGCFWRIMVISTGAQGVGKTGLARWITGSAIRAVEIKPGEMRDANKDVMRRLMQAGITVFDDLNQFGHGERGNLKALVSMTDYHYRKHFGINDGLLLRRSVMYGTTNEAQIIPHDPTGNTRFVVLHVPERLPIKLGELMHEEGVRAGFMSQMLAKLMKLGGEKYEPDISELVEQDEFKETSLIEEKLKEFLELLEEKIQGFIPNGVDIIAHEGKVYFKGDRFWQFFNKGQNYRVKDWERKVLGTTAKGLGLGYIGNDACIRVGGRKIKNLYSVAAGATGAAGGAS